MKRLHYITFLGLNLWLCGSVQGQTKSIFTALDILDDVIVRDVDFEQKKIVGQEELTTEYSIHPDYIENITIQTDLLSHDNRIDRNNANYFYNSFEYGQQTYANVQKVKKNNSRMELPVEPSVKIVGEVNHCTAGNSDASINLTLETGNHNLTSYKWLKLVNGVTSNIELGTNIADIDVDGLDAGLYLFSFYDGVELIDYQFFFVGAEGETTAVVFKLNNSSAQKKYGEDSFLRYNKATGDGTEVGGGKTSIIAASTPVYDAKSLIKYRVGFDSQLTFLKADQTLVSKGHVQTHISNNEGWLSRVTEPWEEHEVTWNTRPSTVEQDRIYIPGTTAHGSQYRNDTIDVLKFVEYWQEHPAENYGYELSLEDYNQSAGANLYYYSSDVGGSYLHVSYTVKAPITSSFDDASNTGTITVNAPDGDLPYTYLLSYKAIPDLATIWNNIKDSTEMDSAFFFAGKENTKQKQFSGLESERYYVTVYDNSGLQIMQETVIVSQIPLLYTGVNIADSGNDVSLGSNTTSNGLATFYGHVLPDEEGGIEFEIIDLGDLVIGFNHELEPKIDGVNGLEFGIEIYGNNELKIISNGLSVGNYNVNIGDNIRLIKSEDAYLVEQNGTLIHTTRIFEKLTKSLVVDLFIPNTSTVKVKKLAYLKAFKQPALITTLIQPVCPATSGMVTLKIPSEYFIHDSPNIIVKDQITGGIVHTGTSGEETISLPIGVYRVSYSYTLAPSALNPYGLSVFRVEEFTIGYPVDWIYTYADNITEISGTNTLKTINLDEVGSAASSNLTPLIEDWWYNFKASGPYSTVYEFAPPFIDIKMNGVGGTALNFHIEPYLFPSMVSKYISLNGTDYTFIHNDNSFTINEQTNALSVIQNGEIILPSSGTPYINPIDGSLRIEMKGYKGIYLSNNLVSYCVPEIIKIADNGYIKEKKRINGGYYDATHGKLQFYIDVEYPLQSPTYVAYSIYDVNNIRVAGVSNNGTSVTGGAPLLVKEKHSNGYEIDLEALGLSDGFYVFETFNIKGEKQLIRFQK